MNKRFVATITFLIALIGVGMAWIFRHSFDFALCAISEPTCINNFSRTSDQLLYGLSAIAIVSFFLFFIPRAISIWWKFAIWYIPLAAIILFTWPQPTGSFGVIPSDLGFGVEQGSQFLATIYIIVSFILIAITSLKKK